MSDHIPGELPIQRTGGRLPVRKHLRPKPRDRHRYPIWLARRDADGDLLYVCPPRTDLEATEYIREFGDEQEIVGEA